MGRSINTDIALTGMMAKNQRFPLFVTGIEGGGVGAIINNPNRRYEFVK